MDVFEKIIKVRYSDIDFDLMLKPSALLQFLQDIASDSAESTDFGYTFVRKHNLAWYLLKYHMEFSTYPKGTCDLKILTEPRGYNRLFAYRDFELYSENNHLARVVSTWSLVNMDTKAIIPVEDVLKDNPHMNPYLKREDDLKYEKIKPLQNIDVEKTYEIRFDDIDVNKHVNNINYIIWAFEPLSFDFRSTKRLKTLDVIFKKEIQYGNCVLSQVEIQGDKTNHILKAEKTGEDLCLISAQWCDK